MKRIRRSPNLSDKDCFGWREDSGYYLVNEDGAHIDIIIEYEKATGDVFKTFNYCSEHYKFQDIKELEKDISFNTIYKLCNPWRYNF